MPLTTGDISIQLLMDANAALQEIEARITARAFGAVHNPEQWPSVRQVLAELLAVLDATSPDSGDLMYLVTRTYEKGARARALLDARKAGQAGLAKPRVPAL